LTEAYAGQKSQAAHPQSLIPLEIRRYKLHFPAWYGWIPRAQWHGAGRLVAVNAVPCHVPHWYRHRGQPRNNNQWSALGTVKLSRAISARVRALSVQRLERIMTLTASMAA